MGREEEKAESWDGIVIVNEMIERISYERWREGIWETKRGGKGRAVLKKRFS